MLCKAAALSLLINALLVPRASAAWNQDGNPSNPGASGVMVTTSSVHSIHDGSGGIFTCWSDNRNGDFDVFLQHLDSNGGVVNGWPSTGLNLCPNLGNQEKSQLATDGAGGAYVVWEDGRHNNTGKDIYAVRVSGSGGFIAGWCQDGAPVTTASGDQLDPNVAPDGSGGALFAYRDASTYYVARMGSTGVTQWANSSASSTINLSAPQLISDGAGGAIIAYLANSNLFGQRFQGTDGQRLWTGSITYPDVVAIDLSGTITENPSITTDDFNGVLIGYTVGDIFFQRVTSAGTVLGSPLIVCNATNSQISPRITTDAANGAVLTWVDNRGGTSFPDIFTQRVRAGSPYFVCWTTNGILVFSGVLSDPRLSIAGDGSGGADIAASTNDISARHVINTGALDSPALLCGATGVQNFTSTALTGTNTTIVTWWDGRNSLEGVYSNQHSFSGPGNDPCPPSVAVPGDERLRNPSRLELSSPSPNPATSGISFDFNVPSTGAGLLLQIGVFDVAGRRVRTVESGQAKAGRFAGQWDLRDDAGHPVSGGLYLVRITLGRDEETRTVLVRH